MAAQWHTPFHAPWAVAGPHGYRLSGVGGTGNEEGSAPPMALYSLRVSGLESWVPPTSGEGVVSPTEPGHHPSIECSGADWTPRLSPSQASLLPSRLPQCGAHLVHETDGGSRPGPAQAIKQGRALQLCAAHPLALTPPLSPPPASRREEAPEDMACSSCSLWWSSLQSVFLLCAHPPATSEDPDSGAWERRRAAASQQALAPLEGRTWWDLWRVIRAGPSLCRFPDSHWPAFLPAARKWVRGRRVQG